VPRSAHCVRVLRPEDHSDRGALAADAPIVPQTRAPWALRPRHRTAIHKGEVPQRH
ncbi:hypothetical protein AJ80_10091, partial [Polytolypa hystricis UAMH7299]